jgi:hypothetical protein
MKKNILVSAMLLLLALAGSAQTKRALIVAIGNYPNPKVNKWKRINSLNDVPLIKNALLNQKFLPENINIITDSMATRSGIENALNGLISSSGAGDIVVIHFSSHGVQLLDDNGDEVDGLDECIVPYGARYSRNDSLFQTYANDYFRDDEFGEKITLLRNKLGRSGDVLVSIDACHSGSATRGGGPLIRGDNPPMVPTTMTDEVKRKMQLKDSAGVFKDNNNATLNADAATYVLFSASQAQENNAECLDEQNNPVGSLSYALSRSLNMLEGKITYRSLFARIEDDMREKVPDQKPVLEGDGIDRDLFGGKFQVQQPYFTVNVDSSSSRLIIVNGGSVAGVTVGSVISFYPGGTLDTTGKKPLDQGTVVALNSFSCSVQLDKDDELLTKKKPYAFITELQYGSNKIKLGVDSLSISADKALLDNLKTLPDAELNSNCDLYLVRYLAGNGYTLRYPVSGALFADNLGTEGENSVKMALKRYGKYHYLRNLKFSEEGISAKVEIVFLDGAGNIDQQKINQHTKFGRLELKVGDVVHLKITNTGTRLFYFNVVDLSPDGTISGVIPFKGFPKPEDDSLAVNSSRILKTTNITIGPPLGEETFKVFLSSELLDLESIITNNIATRGGTFTKLEKVFRNSEENETGTRGGNGKINTAQNGTIFNVNFTIVPK